MYNLADPQPLNSKTDYGTGKQMAMPLCVLFVFRDDRFVHKYDKIALEFLYVHINYILSKNFSSSGIASFRDLRFLVSCTIS